MERSISRNTNFLREIERDFKNICNIDFKVSFNETTLKADQQSEEIRGNNRLKDRLRGSQRNTYLGRDSTKKPLSIAEGLSKSEDTQNGSNILSLHNGTTKISATRIPVPRGAGSLSKAERGLSHGDPLRGSKRAKPHFVGYLGKAKNKTNGNITKGGDLDYKLCEYSFGIKKIENISGFIFSNKLNQIPEYLIKGLNNPKGLYN